MGIYSTARLMWGVPVTAYDEEGQPTVWYDEAEEDWREFEGLKLRAYGHYEDPDTDRAIVGHPSIEAFRGDCWEPKAVPDRALDVEAYQDDAVTEFVNRIAEIDEAAANQRGWYLVCSVG